MMKRLIVNADDVGFSAAVNKAAEKCYEEGAITGVSVMAGGQCFGEAVAMLREIGKTEVGAHLTLTGTAVPCVKDRSRIGTLLDAEGDFVPGHARLAARCLGRRIKPSEMYAELSAQISKIKAAGLEITHLDSHEHVHMLPPVLVITLLLAEEFSIPYVRLPIEGFRAVTYGFRTKDLVRHSALRLFAHCGRVAMVKESAGHNDSFLGHFHAGRLDDGILCSMIKGLPDGLTELAAHPAADSPEFMAEHPWYRNASVEFDALLNGRWRDLAASEGVQLVAHP